MCPEYNKITHISLNNFKELDLYFYRQRETQKHSSNPNGWLKSKSTALCGWTLRMNN